MIDLRKNELWFLTGSQHLYGDETLKQVAEHSHVIADSLDRSGKIAARVVVQADADRSGRDPEGLPGSQRVAGLRRRDHLDAHLLAVEDVDRRADAPARSRWPTCTRSSIAICPGARSTWTS